jgi:serine/threonine protein kinase
VSYLEKESITQELSRSRYRVLGLIGQGQFGRVYCASHRQTGNIVAIKELDKLRFPTHQFLREMQFLVSLAHPNIVSLYALEQTQTGRYIVMDYCEGGTLRSLIQEDICLYPAQALRVVAEMLSGLDHVHRQGVIHCDVKPENILLTFTPEGWTAKLSDFGIARLSQEIGPQDVQLGSPAYMAPECFQGEYSYASDLYAVGIVLFELLTGHRPFAGMPADLKLAHLNQAATMPEGMPMGLQSLIQRSLQKLPAQRFRSAADMREAVQAAAQSIDLSGNVRSDKTQRALLYPTEPLIPSGFRHVYVQPLSSPIRQLVVAETLETLPSGRPRTHLQERLYQVFDRQIQQWHYPQQALLPMDPSLSRQTLLTLEGIKGLHRTQVQLPTSIQAVSLTAQGVVAIAHRRLYHLPSDGFVPGDRQGGIAADIFPEAIAQFPQDVVITTDPQGRWLAAAPQGQRGSLQVGWIRDVPIRLRGTPGIVSSPQQLIALDSRYLLAVCPLPNADSGLLQVLNRRGICVVRQRLGVRLYGMIPTPRPYRLLALELGHANSVVLLDLKPFRMQRIGVGIAPKLLAATPWGYILVAENGSIVVLNQHGQIVGCVAGPPAPTAITPVAVHGLAIATWHQGTGNLHIVDLRQLDLDLVF